MPIRINLLAEAQELEEMRRRDPVKRLIFVGAGLVVLTLAWSASLVVKSMMTKSELAGLEGELNSRTNSYRQILDNKKQLADVNLRLASLRQLATNRFLVGNFMDALQHTTVDEVQVTSLKLEHSYLFTPEVKPSEKDKEQTGKPKKYRPASYTERIVITLAAKDTTSPTPGDGIKQFQESLSTADYFRALLNQAKGFQVMGPWAPQTAPDGKAFIPFTLEARVPEKTR